MRLITAIMVATGVGAVSPALGDETAELKSLLSTSGEVMSSYYYTWGDDTLAGMYAASGNNYTVLEILNQISQSDHAKEFAAVCREGLTSEDPGIRLASASYLSTIEGPAAINEYVIRRYEYADESEAAALAILSAGTGLPRAEDERWTDFITALAADVKSSDPARRRKAIFFAAANPTPTTLPVLKEALKSDDLDVRKKALAGISNYYDDPDAAGVLSLLAEAANDADPEIKKMALAALSRWGGGGDYRPYFNGLKDARLDVRRAAAAGLYDAVGYSYEKTPPDTKLLKKLIKEETDGVTRCFLAAAYGYTQVGDDGSARYLNPNGYWAFLTNTWQEKDFAAYYDAYPPSGGN